jgi:phage replication-related protein YjqB (UPF0714/DUF867 family)
MPDKYKNFADLAQHEDAGIDYQVRVRRARPAFAIIAPHGGGIEPGTAEIADGIAAATHSFYAFDGLKAKKNSDLHITSTHFDEPLCEQLLTTSAVVVTLHGEQSEDGEGVFLGGLDESLGEQIGTALTEQGFDVRVHPNPNLQGREKTNVCNRGTSGAGVQLELSRSVRETLFESLSAEGRKHPTRRFTEFVTAVRTVLDSRSASNVRAAGRS